MTESQQSPAPAEQPPTQPPAQQPPAQQPPAPKPENGLAAFAGKLGELETRIAGLPEAIADALKERNPTPRADQQPPAQPPAQPPVKQQQQQQPPAQPPTPDRKEPNRRTFAERWFS